jgi:hypothetical protein
MTWLPISYFYILYLLLNFLQFGYVKFNNILVANSLDMNFNNTYIYIYIYIHIYIQLDVTYCSFFI